MKQYEKPSALVLKFDVDDAIMMGASAINTDEGWSEMLQYYQYSQITVTKRH